MKNDFDILLSASNMYFPRNFKTQNKFAVNNQNLSTRNLANSGTPVQQCGQAAKPLAAVCC